MPSTDVTGQGDQPQVAASDSNGTTTSGTSNQPSTTQTSPPAAKTVSCPVNISVQNELTGAVAGQFATAFPDIGTQLVQAVADNCPLLYAAQSAAPSGVKEVKLTVSATYDGVAFVSGNGMTISGDYFIRSAANQSSKEGRGVLHHEATHLYQNNQANFPGWAIEGMADFIRYRAGYIDLSERRPGGNYDDAYKTTAFFFDFLEQKRPGIMQRMLVAMADRNAPYSEAWFVREAGGALADLWASYQQTL